MSSTSPAPNSPPEAVPPASNTNNTTPTTPPAGASPPQISPPPPQPSPSTPSPPPQSPPSTVPSSPPPITPSPPSPATPLPLPTPPPPQPAASPPPPPLPSPNPPSSSPPPTPPSSSPPEDPPPPPTAPENSPAPPLSNPPKSSPRPPPPAIPSGASPPPPTRPISEPTPSPPSHVSSPPSFPVPPSGDSSENNTSPTPPVPSDSKGTETTVVVAIGVVAGFVVLGLIVFAVWYWCVRKKRKQSQLNGAYIMPSPMGSPARSESPVTKAYSPIHLIGTASRSSDLSHSPTWTGGLGNSRPFFTHEELVKATNGFSDQNLLGEGGFGAVYKGYLADGRVVAVKQLKVGGGQGDREFKAEVETISRVHHRHLVSLVGYCISEDQRLLVYEYVPNNTLNFHLHGKDRPVLDWATRAKIAAGAARGIGYLHEDCHPRIIHRDIKSSNILLDDNFEARVSDFGLAKLAPDVYTHITTRVMGTFGYLAPEYASSGKLTEKSDVYSFGVVLLELITGRKPVDTSQSIGDESLVQWARPLLTNALDNENFEGLADPRLEGNYVKSEMSRMVEAAAACVRHLASKRPRMVQVARAFDSIDSSDLTNGMKPGQSEAFNFAQQSEEIRFFRRMAFGSQNYSSGFYSQSSSDV